MILTTGIILLVAGNKGMLPSLSNDDERYGFGMIPLRALLGGVLGFLAFTFTSWPVAGFYGFLAGFLGPSQWIATRKRRESIERVEAIATWIETLRDTMAASAGLQEALRLSGAVAPQPIRPEVRAMVARLQHQSVAQALRRFAGDMKHPLADQIVASIILSSMRSAGSLRPILALTSAAARDTGAMWRQVESLRSSSYQQARLSMVISIGLMVLMVAQNRDFLTPFDSGGGQVALFIIFGVFFGSAAVLYRMGRPTVPDRVLAGIERWSFDSPEAFTGDQA